MPEITIETVSKEQFGGRYCATTMAALCVEYNNAGELEVFGCRCVCVRRGKPLFKSDYSNAMLGDLEFVEKESMLGPGKWTWKERV